MIRLLAGDCRDVLATLPAESVQCVVTSPPYYGLRDYGTALWDGGDNTCPHIAERSTGASTLKTDGRPNPGILENHKVPGVPYRDVCGRCGAVRVDRQIGLEPTPDEYLATMVGVFREIRRVLRRDGTCWVNMGDSYAGSTMTGGNNGINASGGEAGFKQMRQFKSKPGLGAAKPKDLLLMPARLALALRADGWWVRSDIIWHKPNPMPESVTDRPTSAHEHVFLLTRSARYYYDADAVREDAEYGRSAETASWHAKADANSAGIRFKSTTTPGNGGTRNLRNVWTIATSPYPNAHFATYPAELAERCIKAGTSERGCCAACGKPWVRVTEETEQYAATKAALKATKVWNRAGIEAIKGPGTGTNPATLPPKSTTTGWSPGCQCGTTVEHFAPFIPAPTVPCTVLDPFAGAGTTLLVADRLQRDAIGIELNTAYTEMAMERCRADAPLFTAFPPAEPPEDERMADLFAEAAE